MKCSESHKVTLPDLSSLDGWLEYGEFDVKLHTVHVRLIVGVAFGGMEWNADWTLNTDDITDECRRNYHEGKLGRLVSGWSEKNLPPITQNWLLSPSGSRLIDFVKVGGIYFVKNGIHRTAAAHLLGLRLIRGTITIATLKRETPPDVKSWLTSLKDKNIC